MREGTAALDNPHASFGLINVHLCIGCGQRIRNILSVELSLVLLVEFLHPEGGTKGFQPYILPRPTPVRSLRHALYIPYSALLLC